MSSALRKSVLQSNSMGHLYPELLSQLYLFGADSKPRGKWTKELLGVQLILNDARMNLAVSEIRDLNYRYAIAEWLWIICGCVDVGTLARYNKRMLDFSDDGKTLAGAYGPRFMPQYEYLVRTLNQDPYSRQAVATIWTPNPAPSKDIPCTIAAQFLNRDGALHSIWTMRSSDAWLGIPYDVFTFTMIQNMIANELDLEIGSFRLNIGSSHIYEEHYDKAYDLFKLGPVETVQAQVLEGYPGTRKIEKYLRQDETVDWLTGVGRTSWYRYFEALQRKTKAECLEVLRAKA